MASADPVPSIKVHLSRAVPVAAPTAAASKPAAPAAAPTAAASTPAVPAAAPTAAESTRAEPILCSQCNKEFSTVSNRNKHERNVHKGKIACPLCTRKIRSDRMEEHNKLVHPNNYGAAKCQHCQRVLKTVDGYLPRHTCR